MAFALREAVDADLNCLTLTTDRFFYGATDLKALRRVWQQVIATKSGLAVVIDVE